MEKRLLVAVLLCVGILVGWSWISARLWPPPPPPAAVAPRAGTPPPGGTPAPGSPGPGNPVPPGPAPVEPATETPLRTKRLEALVTSRGGAALRSLAVWGCTHHDPGDSSVAGDPGVLTASVEGFPAALAIDLIGCGAEGLALASWRQEPAEGGGVRASIERGGVRVLVTLLPSADESAPYHLVQTVTVENLTERAGTPCVLVDVGPWMPVLPIEALYEDGVLFAEVGVHPETLAATSVLEQLQEDPRHEVASEKGWRFIGVRSDFFFCGLIPTDGTTLPPTTTVGFHATNVRAASGPPVATAAADLRIPFTMPAQGASQTWKFMVYAGPNSREVFGAAGSPYAPLEDAFPDRGFWFLRFGWLSRIMGWLLSVLALKVGLGWGLAVCALTVLVRGALFPLSRKSQVSMRVHAQRMGKLKPKLDAMKAKYADNPKKQQEMTMKLFREEKVSILPGGCLLALLQMPVWISLYGTLQTTFEMRHASFLWFHDLTAADHLLELPALRGVWGLGTLTDGWLNLLPILMMITWWGSAAMQPLPEEPEQRAQAKMMRWIPMLFGVMLYRYAAGLALYMTLSALWSIGEIWLIKKVWLSKLIPETAPAKKA